MAYAIVKGYATCGIEGVMCCLAGYNFLIKDCYFFEELHYALDTKEYLIKGILFFY